MSGLSLSFQRMKDGILWSVIINRNTCGRGWRRWEKWLLENEISYEVQETHSLEELRSGLSGLFAAGNRLFLFVGGDGTLHHGVNALIHIAGERSKEITIGLLPCGTGNDWWRSFGAGRAEGQKGGKAEGRNFMMVERLKSGAGRTMPVLKVELDDGTVRYAVNMVGGALDAAVVKLIGKKSIKWPAWVIYPAGLMLALLRDHTWKGRLEMISGRQGEPPMVRGANLFPLKGAELLDGDMLTLQFGVGKFCGGGMQVLPHATADQAGFLIMKPKPLWKILWQTPQIYNGKVIHQKEAIHGYFDAVRIESHGKPVPFEADGEWIGEGSCSITIVYPLNNFL